MKNIWVRLDSGMAELFRVGEVVKEFPTFAYVPNETRTNREIRWDTQHKQLSRDQHKYIQDNCVRAFISGLSRGRVCDDMTAHMIKQELDSVVSKVANETAMVHQSFSLTYTYAIHRCMDFHIQYSLNNHVHTLHICNLSPSEYERYA